MRDPDRTATDARDDPGENDKNPAARPRLWQPALPRPDSRPDAPETAVSAPPPWYSATDTCSARPRRGRSTHHSTRSDTSPTRAAGQHLPPPLEERAPSPTVL